MRIIGGAWKGRTLKTPQSQDIRPTSDKVRLAIFNALFSRGGVANKMVLDMFCGTGALGLESLSQGAAHCLFCDLTKSSLVLAKENAMMLGGMDKASFKQTDAAQIGSRPDTVTKADLIFLDPPYRKNLVPPTIQSLRAGDWLGDGALIVIETEKEDSTPWENGTCVFDKTYGQTRIAFIQT